jgi:hypothetical protein
MGHCRPGFVVHGSIAPQCDALVFGSTHRLPQRTVPAPHESEHIELLHTSPARHAVPHAPQFSGSMLVTVQ